MTERDRAMVSDAIWAAKWLFAIAALIGAGWWLAGCDAPSISDELMRGCVSHVDC